MGGNFSTGLTRNYFVAEQSFGRTSKEGVLVSGGSF